MWLSNRIIHILTRNTTLYSYALGFITCFTNIVGYIPSQTLRKFIYRYILRMKTGSRTYIYSGAKIRFPWRIHIGNHTIIGDHAILDGFYPLRIGSNVNFSTGVWIWTGQHDKNSQTFETVGGPVFIDDYVWISSRTTILPNITIGKGAVVCAGAVVTKNVPPFAIVAGVPAKIIGARITDLHYTLPPPMPFT